jgi:hypothetical protein
MSVRRPLVWPALAATVLVSCSPKAPALYHTASPPPPVPWPLSIAPDGLVVATLVDTEGTAHTVPVHLSPMPQMLDSNGCLASNLGPPRLEVSATCVRLGLDRAPCAASGGYIVSYSCDRAAYEIHPGAAKLIHPPGQPS